MAAFKQAGFKVAIRANYEIPPTHNSSRPERGLKDETGEVLSGAAARVWEGTSEDLRRKVRKAARMFDVDMDTEPSDFIQFYRDNLNAKGKKSYFDLETARKLLWECHARDQLSIMTAIERSTGVAHASLACIFDDKSYYYFLVSNIVDSDQNALRLLIWKQIKKAINGNRGWDFDGVPDRYKGGLNENIERKYQEFHPVAAHRIIVYRDSPHQKAFNAIRSTAAFLRRLTDYGRSLRLVDRNDHTPSLLRPGEHRPTIIRPAD